MRAGFMFAMLSALTTMVADAAPADLKAQAQALIDQASAGGVFEALSDTRRLAVRHRATSFICAFAPDERAALPQSPLPGLAPKIPNLYADAPPGEEGACLGMIGISPVTYVLLHDAKHDAAYILAARAKAARAELGAGTSEIAGPTPLLRDPQRNHAAIPFARLQIVLAAAPSPYRVVQRIAIAALPDHWFVIQSFSTVGVSPGFLPSALQTSEAAFALRLAELVEADRDPALESTP